MLLLFSNIQYVLFGMILIIFVVTPIIFSRFFQTHIFYDQLVVIYVMMFVTIWIKYGRMNLPILYKRTYTFVGDLLYHVYNYLYWLWSNAFLCYILTIIWTTTTKISKNLETSSMILYLIQVPFSFCEFSHLEWTLVQFVLGIFSGKGGGNINLYLKLMVM